ncbi:MAG: hypothetical protein IKN88_07020 [Bacteroidales bacterium]|nr:hypothetical protein [Bacteroidales bacterium]
MKSIARIFAAVCLLTVFSCAKEIENTPVETPDQSASEGRTTYTMTVVAEKGEPGTKALSLSGKTLNATWATTENIYVTDINPESGNIGTNAPRNAAWASSPLHPTASGSSATLTGTFEGITINQGDLLRLQFPKGGTMSYEGQKGTLEDIAANYDYAVAYVNAGEVENGNITPNGPAKFVNQQAIVKFKFLDKAGNSLDVSKLTITASSDKLVQQKAYRDMTVFVPDYTLVTDDCSEGVAVDYKIDNLFNGNLNFKWQSGLGQKKNGAWVVRFHNSETQVDGYTFATCKDTGTETPYYPNRNPKSWVVKAAGNFIGYNTVATVTDDKVMRDESEKWYFYALEKAARYNSFGFEISENQGDEFLQLGELCLLSFNHTTTYGPLTVTPDSPTSELTVALCNDYVNTVNNSFRDNYKIVAIADDDIYDYEKSEVSFEKGKYYEITIKMNKVASLFSVSDNKRVHFAPGNLYWSYGEWRMYANAWEYVGNAANNNNPTATEGSRLDLFCWGATGLNGVAPNTESTFLVDNVNLAGNNDWGNVDLAYNPTGMTGWRTLSNAEWFYLINTRQNARSKMGFATITHDNGLATCGVVLLPDGWILPDGYSFTPGLPDRYSTNIYTKDQWDNMALAGAVFLPAAGQRSGTVVTNVDNPGNPYSDLYSGYYWTSTYSTYLDQENPCAYYVWFSDTGGFNNTTGTEGYRYYEDRRSRGKSVRLVRDAD